MTTQPNTRIDRLASSLEKGVQQVLARGLQDPRVRGLITVTGVEVTPDSKRATIGISVLPAEQQSLTVHGLQSAARHIRREVAELIRTRTMPEFRFVEDSSLKKQAEVLSTLAKVRRELDEKGQDGAQQDGAQQDGAQGGGAQGDGTPDDGPHGDAGRAPGSPADTDR